MKETSTRASWQADAAEKKRLQKEKAAEKRAQRLEEKRVAEEAAQKAEDLLAYKKRLKAQKAARSAERKKKAQQKRWDQNRNEKRRKPAKPPVRRLRTHHKTPSTSKASRIKTWSGNSTALRNIYNIYTIYMYIYILYIYIYTIYIYILYIYIQKCIYIYIYTIYIYIQYIYTYHMYMCKTASSFQFEISQELRGRRPTPQALCRLVAVGCYAWYQQDCCFIDMFNCDNW